MDTNYTINTRIAEIRKFGLGFMELSKKGDNLQKLMEMQGQMEKDMAELRNYALLGAVEAQSAIEEMQDLPKGTVAKRIAEIQIMEQRVEEGDKLSMAKLGREYYFGYFIKKDLEVAVNLFMQAVTDEDNPNAAALFHLGEIYSLKDEYPAYNYEKAANYIGKALEIGPDAEGYLGGTVNYDGAKRRYEDILKQLSCSDEDNIEVDEIIEEFRLDELESLEDFNKRMLENRQRNERLPRTVAIWSIVVTIILSIAMIYFLNDAGLI